MCCSCEGVGVLHYETYEHVRRLKDILKHFIEDEHLMQLKQHLIHFITQSESVEVMLIDLEKEHLHR